MARLTEANAALAARVSELSAESEERGKKVLAAEAELKEAKEKMQKYLNALSLIHI